MAEFGPTELNEIGRRRFLSQLSIGLTGVGAVIVGVPFVIGWLEPTLRAYPTAWRTVGKVDDFKIGDTVEVQYLNAAPLPWTGVSAINGAWLRREDATHFTAFTIYCQHLGCPVRWSQEAELFLCPCHGGVYYADGTVAGGPPPRALPHVSVRVQNGQVQVEATGVPYTY